MTKSATTLAGYTSSPAVMSSPKALASSGRFDTFRDMADQKTVQAMAEATPLGIGKAMTKFLSRSQADLAHPDPSKDDVKTPTG